MMGVWSGLAESPFLDGRPASDRNLLRLIGAVLGGLVVAAVAGIAAWCLTMVGFTTAIGLAPQGLQGLAQAARVLVNPAAEGLPVQIARLVVTAAVDGGFLLVFAAFAVAVAREPLHKAMTSAPQIRWRLVAAGMILAILMLTPLAVAERQFASDGAPPILTIGAGLPDRIAYGAAALLLLPAAAAEELVFRGWLLRRLAAFNAHSAVLIVGTGLVFAAAHLDFNPDAFMTRAIMGGGFAYMTLRLGGIEFSTGVHAAHNMLIVLLLEPLNFQPESTQISAFSLVEDLSLVVGYFIITEAVVHAPLLRRLTGVRRQDLSPPDNERECSLSD